MDLTNPLVYGVPCFLLFIALEIAYSKSHNRKTLYNKKDFLSSLAMGIGSAILGPLIKTIYTVAIFEGAYALFNPEVDGVRQNILGWESFGYSLPVWFACQFLDDLAYYWFHRQNHMCRFFWAAHIVHHSSDHFNLGTAVRNGWFTLAYKPLFYMWIPALGFPPAMVVVCLGIESLWQFQLHTQYITSLGFFDRFMNTHTMHQVHHARNLEYMDKNHGGFLNIFDRMFGTFKKIDNTIDIEYGVTHPPNSYNPLVILTHEYVDIWKDMKKSKNWKDKWMYCFGPPGWSHDGSTLTINQMREKLAKEAKASA
ncbi:MAG: sterol desaturase family protein [Flavobacteriales bacterium]